MEYIFPVAEIEYHIIGFLDPLTDYKQLSLVNKYYYDIVVSDKIYVALKKFCITKPIFYFQKKHNLKNKEKKFIIACSNKNILVAEYLYNKYQINIHAGDEYAFQLSCKNGHLEITKWLRKKGIESNSPIDIHAGNKRAFRWSCKNGHLKVAKWLYKKAIEMNSSINIHEDNEYAFKWSCEKGHLEVI